MAKKIPVSSYPKQPSSSMSPSHPHIGGGAASQSLLSPQQDDEEDDDICPVCESECTCRNRTVVTATSISTSTTSSAPPLKIKLTLPPNLKFRKYPLADSNATYTAPSSHTQNVAGVSSHYASGMYDATASKKRSRPLKGNSSARPPAKATPSTSTLPIRDHAVPARANGYAPPGGKPKGKANVSRIGSSVAKSNKNYVAKGKVKDTNGTTTPAASARTKRNATSSMMASVSDADDSDDDALSTQFPTFVSAASSSSHSSSSASSASESESTLSEDSEIDTESGRFVIRAPKARVKRQLLGDTPAPKKWEHASGNRWEIPQRKKSVGLDEAEVDAESADSSDGDEDAEEDEDDEAEAEADVEAEAPGEPEPDMDMEDMDGKPGVSFGGVRTGWSEDEESSFDADLFFANLDDDSSDSDELDDESDEDPDSLSAEEEDALMLMDVDPSVHVRRDHGELEVGFELDSLSFAWDGQFVYDGTNRTGAEIGFGFEQHEQDVQMETDADSGYEDEEDDNGEIVLQESDGETTEDELIGADGLPNSRAMMLFRWPTTASSVNTVNPMSTMSPVLASPSGVPSTASQTMRIALASLPTPGGSPAPPPTPADILAGRVFFDDMDDGEIDRQTEAASSSGSRRTPGGPLMGRFSAGPQKCAIINGKSAEVPSPFPRSLMRRMRSESTTTLEDIQNDHRRSNTLENSSSLHLSSDEMAGPPPSQTSEELTSDTIELDDVLDASFLDSEPTVPPSSGFEHDTDMQHSSAFPTAADGAHLKNLSRWDRVPMATFRLMREATVPTGMDSENGTMGYNGLGAMISSAMFASNTKPKGNSRAKGNKHAGIVISPMLLPVRDGDLTPTQVSGSFPQQEQGHGNRKSRREQRKEKAMMKRKMLGKQSPQRYQQQHNYHHHGHHHPNMKSRGTSSMQRTNFFSGSSSVPPLNL